MSENSEKKTVKNSIIVGGLIGTAGLFVAKLIGLLYSIPLSRILVYDDLQAYYGTAYQIYSYVLNVFTAGVPFAISTIVAKYTVLDDNKSLMTIRKISMNLLKLLGLAGMLLLVLLSGFIANVVVDEGDTATLANSIRILAVAVFFVPILSSYRGFWQGRKEMGEYAFSQTFEQIFRVGFLLSMAYLIVYVFNMDRKFALYAAVMSTSVAAVAGIIQIYIFDKKKIREISEPAKIQESAGADSKALLKELLILAVPYLGSAVIGYCDSIFNSTLLPVGLRLHGYTTEQNMIILNAVNYVGYKLTSIPQVLSPGFVAALIPHVTEAITKNEKDRVSRIVTECLGIVIFIASMASACIAIYATDIYHVLFVTSDVSLASSAVRWLAIEGFLGTICPVTSSLMIAIGFKKDVLKRQMISAVLKAAVMVPLIYVFGFRGAVLSSVVGNSYVFLGNVKQIDRKYNINLKDLFINLGKVCGALAIMFAVSYALRMIGISGDHGRKLTALVLVVINGMAAVAAYFAAAHVMMIPQNLFHKDFLSVIKGRFSRRKA